jgi:hypothetical protein
LSGFGRRFSLDPGVPVSEAEPGLKDVQSGDGLAGYRFEIVQPPIQLSESVFFAAVVAVCVAVVRVGCGIVRDDPFIVVLFGVFSHKASVVFGPGTRQEGSHPIGNGMVRSPTSRGSDALGHR